MGLRWCNLSYTLDRTLISNSTTGISWWSLLKTGEGRREMKSEGRTILSIIIILIVIFEMSPGGFCTTSNDDLLIWSERVNEYFNRGFTPFPRLFTLYLSPNSPFYQDWIDEPLGVIRTTLYSLEACITIPSWTRLEWTRPDSGNYIHFILYEFQWN